MKKFLLVGILLTLGLITIRADAPLEPQGICKIENAECNVNDSNKLCCPGLVCMDKGVASDIGKCGYLPTPTPTNTPTPTIEPCAKQIIVNQCTYNLIED